MFWQLLENHTNLITALWQIFTATIAAAWLVITFIRDSKKLAIEQNGQIMRRLQELENQIIENPEIQVYLSQNSQQEDSYFRSLTALEDILFYKAKAHVYSQLDLFDEILSFSELTSRRWSFLKPPALTELTDWETLIKVKLRHPLFRSILKHEKSIYGRSLRDFWKENGEEIESISADPFVW